MSRIKKCLAELQQNGRKAVVPYIVAGDPHPDVTVDALHALVAAGADILELGVPFSDPMAEGPAIQLGHERALEHGVGLRGVLDMVASFRKGDPDTPVVLMGYANPIEVIGYESFATLAAESGVDGVLTVDMPPEESAALDDVLSAVGLDIIYLVAPTTTAARSREICDRASGYIYYVSLKGVTGAGNLDTAEVAARVSELKGMTELPICVGFGIKDADSAASIASVADGVVVGSVLVDAMGNASSPENAIAAAKEILVSIVAGANSQ